MTPILSTEDIQAIRLPNNSFILTKKGINYQKSEFSIYPNPIQDRLRLNYQVNSNQQVRVEIRDVTNRLVEQVVLSAGTQSGVNEVNTTSWPRGMYVVTVFEGNYSKKMMILKN